MEGDAEAPPQPPGGASSAQPSSRFASSTAESSHTCSLACPSLACSYVCSNACCCACSRAPACCACCTSCAPAAAGEASCSDIVGDGVAGASTLRRRLTDVRLLVGTLVTISSIETLAAAVRARLGALPELPMESSDDVAGSRATRLGARERGRAGAFTSAARALALGADLRRAAPAGFCWRVSLRRWHSGQSSLAPLSRAPAPLCSRWHALCTHLEQHAQLSQPAALLAPFPPAAASAASASLYVTWQ
mmetsp:Transcript_2767/g.11086  ORF Transcript_2767/g.11086 Transcript_2767/m.11086 type:complete len:249 (+) Transcript_2767:593-1339(+)